MSKNAERLLTALRGLYHRAAWTHHPHGFIVGDLGQGVSISLTTGSVLGVVLVYPGAFTIRGRCSNILGIIPLLTRRLNERLTVSADANLTHALTRLGRLEEHLIRR